MWAIRAPRFIAVIIFAFSHNAHKHTRIAGAAAIMGANMESAAAVFEWCTGCGQRGRFFVGGGEGVPLGAVRADVNLINPLAWLGVWLGVTAIYDASLCLHVLKARPPRAQTNKSSHARVRVAISIYRLENNLIYLKWRRKRARWRCCANDE